jgi:hypothetical protein
MRDLDEYLTYYNTDCFDTGRYTKGRIPHDIVCGARKWEPDRDRLSRLLRNGGN